MTQSLLSTYLNDHLAGATAGVDLFRRAARNHQATGRAGPLAKLTAEVEEDRESLRRLMSSVGVGENKPLLAAAWAAEKVGRFKPNGYVVRRSPLSDLVELEALRAAVLGKRAGWQVLRLVASHDTRLSVAELENLLQRAENQAEVLGKLHLQVAAETIGRPA